MGLFSGPQLLGTQSLGWFGPLRTCQCNKLVRRTAVIGLKSAIIGYTSTKLQRCRLYVGRRQTNGTRRYAPGSPEAWLRRRVATEVHTECRRPGSTPPRASLAQFSGLLLKPPRGAPGDHPGKSRGTKSGSARGSPPPSSVLAVTPAHLKPYLRTSGAYLRVPKDPAHGGSDRSFGCRA